MTALASGDKESSVKITVLGGAGAMGQVIVRDLVESAPVASVKIADFDLGKAEELAESLSSPKLQVAFADIRNTDQLASVLSGETVVINSTPYYLNVKVMEAALQARCHYVDLGGLFHVTRQQMELNEAFKKNKLLAVLGMGAAPGMTNIMAAAGAQELERVDAIDIVVGCVDFAQVEHPMYPPYALDTLLDEYTKEPIVFENGEFKAVPPVSGEMEIDFPAPVGTASAIYTLHSEVATLPLSFESKQVKRVTFRLGLPSIFHERLKFLVELGFGSTEPFAAPEINMAPRQILAKILARFPQPKGDPDDCEVVRVDVTGMRNGAPASVRLEAIVRSCDRWKVSCGALDTGVPPSIVAQMIGAGSLREFGTIAPELCVPSEPFFSELAKRNIIVSKAQQPLLAY